MQTIAGGENAINSQNLPIIQRNWLWGRKGKNGKMEITWKTKGNDQKEHLLRCENSVLVGIIRLCLQPLMIRLEK